MNLKLVEERWIVEPEEGKDPSNTSQCLLPFDF
jgi:hypothetical protein